MCLPITMPLSVCLGLWVLIQICGDSHTETHTLTLTHQRVLAGVALKLHDMKIYNSSSELSKLLDVHQNFPRGEHCLKYIFFLNSFKEVGRLEESWSQLILVY